MRITIVLSIATTICCFACLLAGLAEEPAAARKVKVTIGKDTTFITQPLRPDGYPDYVAALNEFCSRGVTPENNAAVLLQSAFGPRFIGRVGGEFFKALGIEVQPETGDYFQDPDVIIRQFLLAWPENEREAQYDVLDAEFDKAILYPWKAEEHPIVARWLLQNEKPLRLVLDATRRDRKFFPVAPSDQPLDRIPLGYDQRTRYVANALVAQALLLAGEGEIEQAWQYLLACHRLARFAAQGPFLLEFLIGEKIEQMTTTADAALLHHGNLPIKRLSAMQTDLQVLRPLPSALESLDYGERFMYLDVVLHAARGNADVFDDRRGNAGKSLDALSRALDQANVDWDWQLRVGNNLFDRIKQAASIHDRRQRFAAIQAIDKELANLLERIKRPSEAAWDIFTQHGADADFNQQVSDLFVALLVAEIRRKPADLQADAETYSAMQTTAFALAAYRSDHGQYPEKFESLIPEYLPAVPDDPHDPEGFKLQYRREREAYVLWSVGRDGIDDHAHTTDDHPPGDDLVLRPIPK